MPDTRFLKHELCGRSGDANILHHKEMLEVLGGGQYGPRDEAS